MSNKGHKSERLEWQLRYHVDAKKFKSKAEIDSAIKLARAKFLATGDNLVPGIRIEGLWRNPDNRNPLHANWKSTEDLGQSLYGFWSTLGKGRGALY